ncbi:hypothetical protein MKK84_14705 [Methylobacterium sp. E-065]|uniref:glycosyltransferase family 8 protein n=1 Tax=Methylobacterium sp. E-065 TaxID=2836583 RepID=UPI001FBBE2B2|nr:glycosyltransferase [Methylobacterium sp. E-065]MCJ2018673.1 hypothetical protein [Methylobacterium sp. E-065]
MAGGLAMEVFEAGASDLPSLAHHLRRSAIGPRIQSASPAPPRGAFSCACHRRLVLRFRLANCHQPPPFTTQNRMSTLRGYSNLSYEQSDVTSGNCSMGTLMSDCCFCYTTDKYYFLPTLLSAAQARRHISKGKADVLILGFDFQPQDKKFLQQIAAEYDVRVQFHDRREIGNLPIYMARHFLDAILDKRYGNVIHIDGDTQIHADIDPLIEAPLPSGRIFAAPDPMALLCGEPDRLSRKTTAYLRSIGLSSGIAARYINSGVFRVARSDLKAIDQEIQKLCERNLAQYVFTEQDAMNVAFGDRISLISLKWNYPAFFTNFEYNGLRDVHIKHFMSNPRPWHGPFIPWGKAGYSPYTDIISAHPHLKDFYRPMPRRTVVRYMIQQRAKRFLDSRIWQTGAIANKIVEFEKHAAV